MHCSDFISISWCLAEKEAALRDALAVALLAAVPESAATRQELAMLQKQLSQQAKDRENLQQGVQ
jgi:hypothetical protein